MVNFSLASFRNAFRLIKKFLMPHFIFTNVSANILIIFLNGINILNNQKYKNQS